MRTYCSINGHDSDNLAVLLLVSIRFDNCSAIKPRLSGFKQLLEIECFPANLLSYLSLPSLLQPKQFTWARSTPGVIELVSFCPTLRGLLFTSYQRVFVVTSASLYSRACDPSD